MKPKVVYRVQDKDGRGPWKPGFSKHWVEDRPDHEFLVTWPQQFGTKFLDRATIGLNIGCGCRNLNQLRRWFTENEYRTLLGLGYTAVRMKDAKILVESDVQCVFERVKSFKEDYELIVLYPGNEYVSALLEAAERIGYFGWGKKFKYFKDVPLAKVKRG